MKASDVRVGGSYAAKVSDKVVSVRIDAERWVGDKLKGWTATNLSTNKTVTIKSAQRLRGPAEDDQGQAKAQAEAPAAVPAGAKPAGAAKANKQAAKRTEAALPVEVADGTDGAAVAVTTPAAAKGGRKGSKAATPKPDATAATVPPTAAVEPKPLSGLDAAARLLAEAGAPLGCKQIAAEVVAKGWWRTNGRTPASTMYAAITREIEAKGKDARFAKTDRGMFAAAKTA
jgi:hypothetical protein